MSKKFDEGLSLNEDKDSTVCDEKRDEEQSIADELNSSTLGHEEAEDARQDEADAAGDADLCEEESPVELSAEAFASLEEKLKAMNDAYLRERAENENLRRRHERDLQKAYDYSTEKLIRDLLPALDSMLLGLDAAKQDETTNQAFIEGSEMTLKLMLEALRKNGCEMIDPVGEKFDPSVHEAVSVLSDAEKEVNTVLHVTQKGYVLNGRSIRPAHVVVSKKE